MPMGMESSNTRMEIFTKENGGIVKLMEMDPSNTKMGLSTKVNGETISKKGLGLNDGLMGPNTKAAILMARSTVLESTNGTTAHPTQGIGKTI